MTVKYARLRRLNQQITVVLLKVITLFMWSKYEKTTNVQVTVKKAAGADDILHNTKVLLVKVCFIIRRSLLISVCIMV